MTDRTRWRVRLTAAADADLRNILRWTSMNLGEAQSRIYAETLNAAMKALTEGPDVLGVRELKDIAEGVKALHVARGGRKGRHFVVFRADARAESPVINVLRLLHDSMDLSRHVHSVEDDDC